MFSIFDIVIADLDAAKSRKISAGFEFFTDIFGKSTNVSATAAMNADFKFWIIIFQDFDIVDLDLARRDFEVFTLAS